MSKQNKYNALIIGAGKIASGFDDPKSKMILTHAHAYSMQKQISRFAFYDIDYQKALKEACKWGVKAYKNLEEAVSDLQPDIVSICTPNADHYRTIKKLFKLRNKPKVIICEKPVAQNIKDTKNTLRLSKQHKIPILIDHSRRFDKSVQKTAIEIKNGKYGRVISATAHYGKGVIHNGTHIIDLARFFFGEVQLAKSLYAHKDFDNQKDNTVTAFMIFTNCPQFFLIAGNEKYFSHFQFDIICEKKRICFTELGFSVFEQYVISDPIYEGYNILDKAKIRKTNFNFAMLNMIENAVASIEKKEELICDVEDACKTQELCLTLHKQSLKI